MAEPGPHPGNPSGYDAIVVGTGIIGSFVALHLAKAGLRLLVVDRNGLAAGTSRASDGNLLISDKPPGLLFDLTRLSLVLWDETIAELGNHCEYDKKGSVVVTADPDQVDSLRTYVESHAERGVAAEFHGDGFERFEPALGPAVRGLGWWPQDVQIQPMLACYQIARHLQAQGTDYRLYDELIDFRCGASGVAATFGNGDTVAADYLMLCTGVWITAILEKHGIHLPVIPRKGQICVLERGGPTIRTKIADFAYMGTVEEADPADAGARTAAIIEGTRSGTILCGSSREFAGFDLSLDNRLLGRIVGDCIRFVPALADLRVIRAYAGLRPYCPDDLPAVGPVDDHGRLYVATGHEGTGHGLAPVTGAMVAALVSGAGHPLAAPLDPKRFLS